MICNDMRKIQNKKFIFNILKLAWAVIILYLWLKFNIFNIWEKKLFTDDMLSSGSFSQSLNTTWNINGLDDELKDLIWKHNSSQDDLEEEVDLQEKDLDWEKNEYKMKYQRLCISNMSLCSKVEFEWDYEYKEKYMYLASTMYILNNIEKNIQFGKTIKKQLDVITINNKVWTRRGYATWDDIVINLWTVPSYLEFFELLTHEIWHVVDLGMVRWFSKTKSPIYTEFGRKVFEKDDPSIAFYQVSWKSEKVRKADASREDFCSGYGMSDPFEDFAECHNWYLNHNAIFKKIAKTNDSMKKKYNFMANLYGGVYLFDAEDDLKKIKYNEDWRPWDTTRM